MSQSASRPQQVEPSQSELKYGTQMKHMYNSIATCLVGTSIICQYTNILTNNAQGLHPADLDSNVRQTEYENIFCLYWDLNPDL